VPQVRVTVDERQADMVCEGNTSLQQTTLRETQGERADVTVRNIVPAIQDFPDDGPCSAITAPTTNHYINSSRWNIQSNSSANHRLGGMLMIHGERAIHNLQDFSSILLPCWSVDGI